MTYIDHKGRTWLKFSVEYNHPIDEQTFTFEIWAIDQSDAIERVEYIKQNAVLAGQIVETVAR